MVDNNRPNYFLLLELDPEAPWDQSVFDRRLRSKRNYWSRKVSNGVKTNPAVMRARYGLDHLSDIESRMSDPAGRDRERTAALDELARGRSGRQTEFEQDLAIMLAKGFLHDVEITKICDDYPDIVADPDVVQRLAVSRRDSEQDRIPERLDPSTASTIRVLLDSLGEKSLYTLLAQVDPGIDARSELDTLRAAARQLYERTQSAIKHDADLDAKHDLAGYAMNVFGSPEQRVRYDNTLALAPVDDLLRRYQSVLAAVKRVDSAQAERFLREACNAGADPDLARAMLLKHFGDLKWTVVLAVTDTDEPADTRMRCPACQTAHAPDDDFCQECGTRFRVACPSCSRTVPGHGACGGCGFPVGDRDWVRFLLEDCDELLCDEDLDGAERKLKEAGRAWPLPADSTDELAVWHRRCAQGCHELGGRRTAADQEVAERLRTMMASKQYLAALRMAVSASTTVPDRERIIRESESHVREADHQYEVAQRPGIDPHRRATLLRSALAACADHDQSVRALRQLPPDPPRDLHVVAAENLVHLRWQPSSTSGVRYVVVRKRGVLPPMSATDGSRLDSVVAQHYDDVSPEYGVPVRYAVFADRMGTMSQESAGSTDTVFLAGDVTITSRRVADGVVELAWTLPPHATGLDIRRSTGRPAEADAATNVEPTERNRLCDKGLRNGVTYTYTLHARYDDGTPGETRRSRGVSVSLTPGPTPAAPKAVGVRMVERNVGISYRHVDLLPDPLEQDAVSVLWSQDRPRVRDGDLIDVTDIAGYGSLLTGTDLRGHALFASGLYYFTSVIIRHELGYVGGVRRYAAVPEITDLTATNLGDAIRLQWTWPQRCDAVLVAHDDVDRPADPTVARHQSTVERDDYDRHGHHDVRAGNGECFFVIAVIVRDGGEAFVSSGVRCRARIRPRIRLDYDVTSSKGHNHVRLRVSEPVLLPRLVLVGKPTGPPADEHDGDIQYEQDAIRVRKTHTITFPAVGRTMFAGLFPRGDTDDIDVQIVPPSSPDQLRLS